MIGHKRPTILEGVIVFGLTACAYAFSEVIGLAPAWKDGVVYTAAVFATVVAVLRPAWGRKTFWKGLTLFFVGHVIALFVLLQELPNRRFGLLMFLAGAVEGVFILGMLWREMVPSKNSGPLP